MSNHIYIKNRRKKVMKEIYLRSYYVKEYKKIENSWNN